MQMKPEIETGAAEVFDRAAAEYAEQLQQGLQLSGESAQYFVSGRVNRTREWCAQLGLSPQSVLDFGCGTGQAIADLAKAFTGARLEGVDVSAQSLATADRANPGIARWTLLGDWKPDASVDLVYCNGVMHHVPPPERDQVYAMLYACLRPGGVLCMWDNSPWSPAARWVMSRIPFDRDAIMVWPSAMRAGLVRAGFDYLRREYHFIFPSLLAALRPIETVLRPVPVGAQYLVLARKPL
jgi:SAM-dependent methyltransferase